MLQPKRPLEILESLIHLHIHHLEEKHVVEHQKCQSVHPYKILCVLKAQIKL